MEISSPPKFGTCEKSVGREFEVGNPSQGNARLFGLWGDALYIGVFYDYRAYDLCMRAT